MFNELNNRRFQNKYKKMEEDEQRYERLLCVTMRTIFLWLSVHQQEYAKNRGFIKK